MYGNHYADDEDGLFAGTSDNYAYAPACGYWPSGDSSELNGWTDTFYDGDIGPYTLGSFTGVFTGCYSGVTVDDPIWENNYSFSGDFCYALFPAAGEPPADAPGSTCCWYSSDGQTYGPDYIGAISWWADAYAPYAAANHESCGMYWSQDMYVYFAYGDDGDYATNTNGPWFDTSGTFWTQRENAYCYYGSTDGEGCEAY